MRFFTFLTLFMLPTTVVQFYSTDSYALANKTAQQEILFDNTVFPRGHDSNISAVTQIDNKQAKINIEPPVKRKKVRIVDGKRNSQGMQLLSLLLMLKDSRR